MCAHFYLAIPIPQIGIAFSPKTYPLVRQDREKTHSLKASSPCRGLRPCGPLLTEERKPKLTL